MCRLMAGSNREGGDKGSKVKSHRAIPLRKVIGLISSAKLVFTADLKESIFHA